MDEAGTSTSSESPRRASAAEPLDLRLTERPVVGQARVEREEVAGGRVREHVQDDEQRVAPGERVVVLEGAAAFRVGVGARARQVQQALTAGAIDLRGGVAAALAVPAADHRIVSGVGRQIAERAPVIDVGLPRHRRVGGRRVEPELVIVEHVAQVHDEVRRGRLHVPTDGGEDRLVALIGKAEIAIRCACR